MHWYVEWIGENMRKESHRTKTPLAVNWVNGSFPDT
jgi:hypothetical protein